MGNAAWELYLLEHGLTADGHVNPDIATDIHRNDSYETIFTELGNGKFVPRSIFVDLDPSPIDEIHTGWYGIPSPNIWRITNGTGFGTFMSMLAVPVTEAILGDSNYTVEGIVWTPVVEVRWGWIVLPAFLVLAGNIFFVLTVRTSRREKVLPWKSSTLALLYHGLEKVEPDNGHYTTAIGMEMMATAVDVRLGVSEEGALGDAAFIASPDRREAGVVDS